jgi:hypothetical protein
MRITGPHVLDSSDDLDAQNVEPLVYRLDPLCR